MTFFPIFWPARRAIQSPVSEKIPRLFRDWGTAINLPSFLDLAVERVLLASVRESFFEDYFGRRLEIFLAMLNR